MILLVIFIVVALAAAGLLWSFVRGERTPIANLDELMGQTQPVDIEAFRNLTSADERQYLRSQLSSADYRKVQRLRIRAALGYVRAAGNNARLLARAGEAARQSADPELAAAGEQLVATAVSVRMHAMMAVARLYPGLWLPGVDTGVADILPRYEQLKSSFSRVGAMENPVGASRVAAVL